MGQCGNNTSRTLALRRWRQDQDFKITLGHLRSCFKKPKARKYHTDCSNSKWERRAAPSNGDGSGVWGLEKEQWVVKGPALPAAITSQHSRDKDTAKCLNDLQGHTLNPARPTPRRRAKSSGLGGPCSVEEHRPWPPGLLSYCLRSSKFNLKMGTSAPFPKVWLSD